MDTNEVLKIKDLIKQAEMQSAKSQGIIENIKTDWKKEFGTDDVDEIKKILDEKRMEYKQTSERLDKLYQKLLDSYDWDKLADELD